MCINFLVGAGLKTKVGCYLYWDKERKVFIRSGKATRDFEHRHKEHKAGSLLKNSRDLQSKFYASYPSAAVIDKVDEPLGVFESLTMYCGIGFEMGNSNSTDKICQEKGGYLHWSKEILDYLSKKRSLNAAQLKTVKVEMVSYLFELCYDLCLGKQDNISSSPGFEKFLGQFGRGREC